MPIKTPQHVYGLSKRKKDTVTPFVLINLSHTENLRLKKDTVVAFAGKDETKGEVFHIETLDTTPPPKLDKSANAANVHSVR